MACRLEGVPGVVVVHRQVGPHTRAVLHRPEEHHRLVEPHTQEAAHHRPVGEHRMRVVVGDNQAGVDILVGVDRPEEDIHSLVGAEAVLPQQELDTCSWGCQGPANWRVLAPWPLQQEDAEQLQLAGVAVAAREVVAVEPQVQAHWLLNTP